MPVKNHVNHELRHKRNEGIQEGHFVNQQAYTDHNRDTSRNEKNPELLFVDARPHVNRKPSPDDLWGIELKETHELIGQIEVFDVQNDRYGMVGYRVAPGLWNRGIGTEAM